MSQALAGTPQFMVAIGATSPTQAATLGMITTLCAHAGVAVGSGAMANVGLPIWQVLQNFATSTLVSNALAEPIANFQNLLLAGGTAPAGSILTLPGTPGASLTLTAGIDSPTQGFASGHGATATSAGAVFTAAAVNNPPLGVTNSLSIGDNLQTTGAAVGDTTLMFTAVPSVFPNLPDPTAITMNGVNAVVVDNISGGLAGFSGVITGLTSATVTGGDLGNVRLGVAGNGLNTALTDVTMDVNHTFTAWMTTAAFAGAPTGTVHLTGVDATVNLNTTGTGGYAQLDVDSGGTTGNTLVLNTNADTTANITVLGTGVEPLTISGTALNIGNLHTFNGTAATGALDVFFNGFGAVAATGGAGDDTFTFTVAAGDAGSFSGSGSTVDGGAGTNTLVIQADTGTILDGAGDNAGIKNIATVVHDTVNADGATGNFTADLTGLAPATVFDLNGSYFNTGTLVDHTIDVTNIANDQTVEFSGSGGILTLAAPAPLELDAQINLQLSNAPDVLDQLIVAPGLASLNVHGLDGGGSIANVSTVADNVNIDGDSFVTFGTSFAGGFTHTSPLEARGGVIDALTDTGGVDVWLPHLPAFGANGTTIAGNAGWIQTFIGGTGSNFVHVDQFGGDVIDFTGAGASTAEFNIANFSSGHPINDLGIPLGTPHQYNNVLGFAADDTINVVSAPALVSGGLAGVSFTNGTGVVPTLPGPATDTFDFTTDTVLANASIDPFNFIKIDPPIGVTTGSTVQAGFAEAMGTLGSITVGGGTHAYLTSFYDSNTGEAVIGAVHATGLIVGADHIDVIGLVHMSAATYAGFTPHFT